ncbi:MAG TPA: ShlB/FhaC/HecB family hemolysin secretion/activation protein [Terriglobales bacterium]|nr:ShlB/FhaC/HecB family hemolysin secretion/activation protein [Terriglobales bacterium]
MKAKRVLSIIIVQVVLFCVSLYSQVPLGVEPGAVQHGSRQVLDHYESTSKISVPFTLTSPISGNTNLNASAVAPASTTVEMVLLNRVVTDASDILNSDDIRGVTSKYEGRQVSISELNGMVADLNDLYSKKGFTMARAVLPPQSVQDGVVRVRLVEGRIGEVFVQTGTHTHNSYVLNRIPLKTGELIDVNELQRTLAYFNATNDLKLHAELQPGRAFGTANVVLQGEGPEDAEVTFFFDNAGRDTIGNYRGGTMVRFNSLFGNRDPLLVGFLGANGTLSGFGSYSVPLGLHGLRIGGGFDYNTIEINSGPLESVGIVGHAFDATLRLTSPLVAHSTTTLNGFATAHLKKSLLQSEGYPLTHTRVRSIEVGADFQKFDNHGLWYFSNMINTGFHDLGGSNTFLRYNGTVARVFTFRNNMRTILRASGQANALDPLPPIEQFQIGGVATVRGYPEGRLIGNNGMNLTGEFNIPMRVGEKDLLGTYLSKRLTLALFVDHGKVFDEGFSDSIYDHMTSLTSAGFGVSFNLPMRLTGRVDVGFPLQNRNGISSVGVNFYLQTTYPFSRMWNRNK